MPPAVWTDRPPNHATPHAVAREEQKHRNIVVISDPLRKSRRIRNDLSESAKSLSERRNWSGFLVQFGWSRMRDRSSYSHLSAPGSSAVREMRSGQSHVFQSQTCARKCAMLTFLLCISTIQGCSMMRHGDARLEESFSRLQRTQSVI